MKKRVRLGKCARHFFLVLVVAGCGTVPTQNYYVLTATVAPDRPAYVSWGRGRARPRLTDAETYDAARTTLVEYWERRLAEGASFVVPEPVVMAAERALLVQNLSLTWRYSIGNPYEEFSFPESLDEAQVMSEWGFGPVARSILRYHPPDSPRRPG